MFWPVDDKWYRGTLVSIKPTEHKQRARTDSLPIASTGERTGNCFLAAILAHVLKLDLQTQKVPEAHIMRLRQNGVPRTGYLDGRAQQLVAERLDIGYAVVNPASRCASLYVVHKKPPQDLLWAVLVQESRHHTEPLATGGGKRCGLVTHDQLETFMAGLGGWIVPPPNGERMDLAGSGSDDSDAEGESVADCKSSSGMSDAAPDSDAETDAGMGGDRIRADYHIAYDDGQKLRERLATELPYRWLADAPATRPNADASAASMMLSATGYTVLGNAVLKHVCTRMVGCLRAARWDTRGLPSHEGPDGHVVHDERRQQTTASSAGWISDVTSHLTEALQDEDLLAGGSAVVRVHGLKSLPSAGYVASDDPQVRQDADQQPHVDEEQGRYRAWVRKQTDHLRRPMSLLLAIMPGTRLRLFANRRWQLLELDVGDVLVFAGDVKHNGVGYPVEHLRIHAHLYPAGYDHVGEIQFSQADLGTDD